jgi:hypothetical protein
MPHLIVYRFCLYLLLILSSSFSISAYAAPIFELLSPPTLTGTKSGSSVQLYWSMGCSITSANIQESQDGTTWQTVYDGLGNPYDGGVVSRVSTPSSFSTVPLQPSAIDLVLGPGPTICTGWTSQRTLSLSGKTKSGYYYRAKVCDSSGCGRYSSNVLVGSVSSGGGSPSNGVLADISTIPDSTNGQTSPAQSDLVGEIKGNAGVDGGAFSYSVPLTIAPGRKGVQPSLSLNYSSQSGEGIAGMGWSLSANSSISRCSYIFDLDGSTVNSTFSSEDKICYNGSRLVAVAANAGGSVGNYGSSGTFYQTERDGSVIVQQLGGTLNSSGVYFVASEVNGTQHIFGQSTNSRIVPAGLSLASTWLQDTTRDSHGNEVSYQYDEASAGNRYLLDIYYTGHKGVLGTRHIHFDYKTIPGSKSYQWGGYSVHDRQLMNISMNIEGQEKAMWLLNYQAPTSSLNDAVVLDNLEYCDASNNDCLKTEFT